MGKMSRRKGAAGEREAAAKLNEVLGTRFHRGRQYHGGHESPDLAGDLPGLNIEVKRTECLSLYKALRQAQQDADVSQVPVVMHRANGKPWVMIVEVDQLIRLLDVVDQHRARIETQEPSRESLTTKHAKETKTAGNGLPEKEGGTDDAVPSLPTC